MEVKIQKQIIDFFAFFEEFYNSVNASLKDCQKSIIVVNKYNARCKNIKQAELVGSPLEGFVDLPRKLCSKIYNLASVEVAEIQKHMVEIEDTFEKLCNKHKILNESCEALNQAVETQLIQGNPLQPSLNTLLEFSEAIITFGSQICAQIKTTLEVLALKSNNAEIPVENFRVPKVWQEQIKEILSYTSFCSENQI